MSELALSRAGADFIAAIDKSIEWLSKAQSIQEVMEVASVADAGIHIAKTTDEHNKAAELKILCEHTLGRMLAASEKNKGGTPEKSTPNKSVGVERIPTYLESGIDYNRASRAQKLYKAQPDEQKVKEAIKSKTEHGEIKPQQVAASIIRESERAKNAANLQEIAAKCPGTPEGVFDVIVIDPPWPVHKIEMDWRENHVDMPYPTMTIQELKDWQLPIEKAADDCHLFLWATEKMLPLAFDIVESWELKYVLTFVWHKPNGFQPLNLPTYNCEFCVYARKGAPEFVTTKAFFTCFNGPQGKHSEKPSEFYDMIRRVTGGRRLDMFNRRKIEGFIGWGNESL